MLSISNGEGMSPLSSLGDYERRIAHQTLAWFNDLGTRNLLDLDPPYQRRSVWNLAYRQYFIETVLLNYPAPPVFLYEAISPQGIASYSVVDGKQRIGTVLAFVNDDFPIAERGPLDSLSGKYFSEFDDESRQALWRYQLLVEFLPVVDQGTLKVIFDRLNRNVAKLTRQELRHARFSGLFATAAEEVSEVLDDLPQGFPRIAPSSRRQMKDIEVAAQLLLLTEVGPLSFSQDDLDQAYSDRDGTWEEKSRVERQLRKALERIGEIAEEPTGNLAASRMQNQADFFSLVGAVLELLDEKDETPPAEAAARLINFMDAVSDEDMRQKRPSARRYYDAARSASNDLKQRNTRIGIIRDVMVGVEPESFEEE